MKQLITTAVLFTAILTACNNNTGEAKKTDEMNNTLTANAADSNKLYACPMHPEVTGKKGEKCSKCGMELTKEVSVTVNSSAKENTITDSATKQATAPVSPDKFSIADIVGNYLKLKNALVKDDTKAAASAGKALFISFNSASNASLDEKQKKEFADIADDAKEHSEHIGANAGKIDHQREHFATLSKDVNDLIQMFGTSQKLYQDFCPMYDDGKGASWISETKEIKNPFYGSQMLTCGSVKKSY